MAVTPAQAFVSYSLSSSFSSPGPGVTAIDESTGAVYVVGGGLQKFSASGEPLDFAALGTNILDGVHGGPDYNHNGAFGGWSGPPAVAVDNSGGHTQGYIYVAHGPQADVFLPSGQFIGAVLQPTNSFHEIAPNANIGQKCGVAVDPNGDLFLASPSAWTPYGFPRSFVDEFIPGLHDTPNDWVPRSALITQDEGNCSIAVDSIGSIYTKNGSGAFALNPLVKYNSGLFDQGLDVHPKEILSSTSVFAVDSSTDDVYAVNTEGGLGNFGNFAIERFNSSGTLVERFGSGEILFPGGLGINSSTGTVYATEPFFGLINVFTAAVTPDIIDVAASTGQTTATVSAQVAPAGTSTVSDCQVEYGPDTSYGSSVPCSPATPYTEPTEITAIVPGLTTEEDYHYRIVVTNSNGSHKALDHTFTTHAVADVSADPPTDVTQTSATLTGSFTGDGDATTYYFEWGPDTSYGNTTAVPPGDNAGSASGTQNLSAPISGLAVYTKYHYRLVASNSAGTTYGPDRLFYSAPPFLPEVSATGASAVTPTTATLSAQVNPGLGETFYLFEYGTSPLYGSETPLSASIGSDNADHPVSSDITGLVPGTTYHYRVAAINFTGTTNGPEQTFDTPAAPLVLESSVSGVTQTSANLSALFRPGFRPTTYHFEYGPSAAYGSSTTESPLIGSDNLSHPAAATLSGLAPGTTYHFRLVATNAIGTANGPDRSLITVPASSKVIPPTPKRCKRGFVRRMGKCVGKRHRPKRHHRARRHMTHHRHTTRSHG